MATIGRPKAVLVVTEAERGELVRLTKRAGVNRALAFRARLVLACAAAASNTIVARRHRTSNATVGKWRTRFIERRLAGLYDEPRVGAPRTISDDAVEAVIVKTLETRDPRARPSPPLKVLLTVFRGNSCRYARPSRTGAHVCRGVHRLSRPTPFCGMARSLLIIRGSCTRNRPRIPRTCCTTWRGTPIASPSPSPLSPVPTTRSRFGECYHGIRSAPDDDFEEVLRRLLLPSFLRLRPIRTLPARRPVSHPRPRTCARCSRRRLPPPALLRATPRDVACPRCGAPMRVSNG